MTDETDHAAEVPTGVVVALIAGLHAICCGLPLLLLSGVSLATIFPSWPIVGVLVAFVGIVGVSLYLRKGCAPCPGSPKRQPQQKDEVRGRVSY